MNKVNVDTKKDIQLLKGIARTGFITESLCHYFELPTRRLEAHVKNGHIEKRGIYILYGSFANIYTLRPMGKKRVKAEFLINPYKSDFSQLEHDYCLAKIYWMLGEAEREEWLTETQLKMKYGKKTVVDAMFLAHNGAKVGVEVISNTYTRDIIMQKQDFLVNECDHSIILHTHKEMENWV